MKSKTTALILSILVGGLGIDRFYLGYTGIGVLKLLTGGGLGILWIIDILNIANGQLGPSDGSPYNDDLMVRSTTPQPAESPYEQLEKVAKLHDAGVLSEEEFNMLKTDLLKRI